MNIQSIRDHRVTPKTDFHFYMDDGSAPATPVNRSLTAEDLRITPGFATRQKAARVAAGQGVPRVETDGGNPDFDSFNGSLFKGSKVLASTGVKPGPPRQPQGYPSQSSTWRPEQQQGFSHGHVQPPLEEHIPAPLPGSPQSVGSEAQGSTLGSVAGDYRAIMAMLRNARGGQAAGRVARNYVASQAGTWDTLSEYSDTNSVVSNLPPLDNNYHNRQWGGDGRIGMPPSASSLWTEDIGDGGGPFGYEGQRGTASEKTNPVGPQPPPMSSTPFPTSPTHMTDSHRPLGGRRHKDQETCSLAAWLRSGAPRPQPLDARWSETDLATARSNGSTLGNPQHPMSNRRSSLGTGQEGPTDRPLDLSGERLVSLHGLSILGPGGYKWVGWLKTVTLAHNSLQDIAALAGALPYLEVLDLSYNQLSYLDTPVLATLPRLRWLCFDGNIMDTGALAFAPQNQQPVPLPALKALSVRNNYLQSVGVGFDLHSPLFPLLEELNADNNLVTSLRVSGCTNLRLVSAVCNMIGKPRSGRQSTHTGATTTTATNNNNTSLGRSTEDNAPFLVLPESVREVVLDHNFINSLHPFVGLPELQVLRLSHNTVSDGHGLRDEEGTGGTLRVLDLSANRLLALDFIADMPVFFQALSVLLVCSNNLQSEGAILTPLHGLEYLTHLDTRNNPVTALLYPQPRQKATEPSTMNPEHALGGRMVDGRVNIEATVAASPADLEPEVPVGRLRYRLGVVAAHPSIQFLDGLVVGTLERHMADDAAQASLLHNQQPGGVATALLTDEELFQMYRRLPDFRSPRLPSDVAQQQPNGDQHHTASHTSTVNTSTHLPPHHQHFDPPPSTSINRDPSTHSTLGAKHDESKRGDTINGNSMGFAQTQPEPSGLDGHSMQQSVLSADHRDLGLRNQSDRPNNSQSHTAQPAVSVKEKQPQQSQPPPRQHRFEIPNGKSGDFGPQTPSRTGVSQSFASALPLPKPIPQPTNHLLRSSPAVMVSTAPPCTHINTSTKHPQQSTLTTSHRPQPPQPTPTTTQHPYASQNAGTQTSFFISPYERPPVFTQSNGGGTQTYVDPNDHTSHAVPPQSAISSDFPRTFTGYQPVYQTPTKQPENPRVDNSQYPTPAGDKFSRSDGDVKTHAGVHTPQEPRQFSRSNGYTIPVEQISSQGTTSSHWTDYTASSNGSRLVAPGDARRLHIRKLEAEIQLAIDSLKKSEGGSSSPTGNGGGYGRKEFDDLMARMAGLGVSVGQHAQAHGPPSTFSDPGPPHPLIGDSEPLLALHSPSLRHTVASYLRSATHQSDTHTHTASSAPRLNGGFAVPQGTFTSTATNHTPHIDPTNAPPVKQPPPPPPTQPPPGYGLPLAEHYHTPHTAPSTQTPPHNHTPTATQHKPRQNTYESQSGAAKSARGSIPREWFDSVSDAAKLQQHMHSPRGSCDDRGPNGKGKVWDFTNTKRSASSFWERSKTAAAAAAAAEVGSQNAKTAYGRDRAAGKMWDSREIYGLNLNGDTTPRKGHSKTAPIRVTPSPRHRNSTTSDASRHTSHHSVSSHSSTHAPVHSPHHPYAQHYHHTHNNHMNHTERPVFSPPSPPLPARQPVSQFASTDPASGPKQQILQTVHTQAKSAGVGLDISSLIPQPPEELFPDSLEFALCRQLIESGQPRFGSGVPRKCTRVVRTLQPEAYHRLLVLSNGAPGDLWVYAYSAGPEELARVGREGSFGLPVRKPIPLDLSLDRADVYGMEYTPEKATEAIGCVLLCVGCVGEVMEGGELTREDMVGSGGAQKAEEISEAGYGSVRVGGEGGECYVCLSVFRCVPVYLCEYTIEL